MSQPIALGTVLEVSSRYDGTAKFIAAEYNDEGYLKMTKEGQPDTFITVHPGHATRIAANGADSGIKVLNANTLADIIVKATPVVKAVPAPVIVGGATQGNGQSKKDRALALKAANPNATRKELIQMFVEQLGMTPAGASTYASMKG